MMAETLTTRMAVMPDLVRDLEQRVGNGEVPPEGLDNVKAAIDDIRLRLWPLLVSAHDPADRRGSIQRFRLRRAMDVCRAASRDLESEQVELPHEELAELRLAADKLASQVEQKFGPR
jgi:hypothetical protein